MKLAVLLCSFCLALVLPSPARAHDDSGRQSRLNGGYYLLHHLCEDESQLPLLVDLKTTPPGVVDYVKRIGQTAKESLASLDRIQEHDPAIRFDENPLPAIERDVRQSIRGAKQHRLLFGTSNGDFVRALLVSQIEASNYALNIARVLADQEDNPARIKTLHQIQSHWQAIMDQAYRQLKQG